MTKNERLKKQIDSIRLKIKSVVRHVEKVQSNCLMLGEKLIDSGEIELGKQLIASGYRHDNSKFHGIEFEALTGEAPTTKDDKKLKLKFAVHHHNLTNDHHPEYWNGIKNMPRVALGEAVCDWKARSEEFGTNLREWITESATKRFGFKEDDEVGKQIMEFVNLLCEKPFTEIKQ